MQTRNRHTQRQNQPFLAALVLIVVIVAGAGSASTQSPTPVELVAQAKQGDVAAMSKLGDIYRKGEGVVVDMDMALAWYQKAANNNDPEGLFYLGYILSNRGRPGDLETALAGLNRALAIFEKTYGPENGKIATVEMNLGNVYFQLARYDEALDAYRLALRIEEKTYGADQADVAEVLNNMGNVYLNLTRYDEALAAYRRALAIEEKTYGPDHANVATVLNNMGNVYDDLTRYDEALAAYGRALAIREKTYGPDHAKVANVLNNMGEIYFKFSRYDAALPTVRRALAIYEKTYGPDHTKVAAAVMNMGVVYANLARYDEALAAYGRALSVYDHDRAANVDHLRRTYNNLAYLAQAQDDRPGTIFFAKLAVNAQQQIRAQNTGLSDDLAQSLTDSGDDIYQTLSDALIAKGRLAEAMFVLDLLKEQELFEFVRGNEGDHVRDTIALTPTEQQQQDALQAAMDAPLGVSLEAMALRDKKDAGGLNEDETARLATLDAQLNAAYARFAGQIRDILRQARTESRTVEREVSELDLRYTRAMQDDLKAFGGRAVLLRIAALDSGLHLFVTTPDASVARKVEITREELSKLVFAAVSAVEARDPNANGKLQALYDVLIAPVADDLAASGADTIMLNLGGFLRYVPFSALYDGQHYLIKRYALTMHTPAAQTEYAAIDRDRSSAAGFGVTAASPDLGFSALPGVATELEAIFTGTDANGQLSGLPLLDAGFSPSSFQSALASRPQIVHVASHFKFVPGSETDSFLLLGSGDKLTLDKFRTERGYRFTGVDLLTLSACSTARGDDANGSEVESFGTMAQQAGVSAVMATLWPVSDASTAQLMTDFYAGLIENDLDKAAALRRAQLALLRGQEAADIDLSRGAISFGTAPEHVETSTAHPYFWAPFILMGNWL